MEAKLTDEEAQEVVQETVISVCKAMPSFRYDRKQGSFKSWLLQLTLWRIKDQLRKRAYDYRAKELHSRYVDDLSIDRPTSDLEQRWDREWDATLLHAAVDRVKRRIDPRQFQLFDAYVVQQWPMEKIRSVLNASRGAVYVAKHRVALAIRRELHYLKKQCY